MKQPTIHHYVRRIDSELLKKVHMRSERALTLSQLVDGLCSRYYRDRYEGCEPLPELLSLDELWETIRDEYDRHGDSNVWTWSDPLGESEDKEAREWAKKLIIAAIPGLEGEKS